MRSRRTLAALRMPQEPLSLASYQRLQGNLLRCSEVGMGRARYNVRRSLLQALGVPSALGGLQDVSIPSDWLFAIFEGFLLLPGKFRILTEHPSFPWNPGWGERRIEPTCYLYRGDRLRVGV